MCRHNFAPNGPDFGEKGEQKRRVAPKKRGILITWSVRLFICPKFNPVLDFSAPGPDRQRFRSKGLKIYLIYTDNEAVAKVLCGEDRRRRPLASSPKDYLQEGQFLGFFVGPEKRRRENVS